MVIDASKVHVRHDRLFQHLHDRALSLIIISWIVYKDVRQQSRTVRRGEYNNHCCSVTGEWQVWHSQGWPRYIWMELWPNLPYWSWISWQSYLDDPKLHCSSIKVTSKDCEDMRRVWREVWCPIKWNESCWHNL